MMVLWLLMLRAIGIEFRAHIENPVWQGFLRGDIQRFKRLPRDLSGRRLGQRHSRRAARSRRLLLRATVDKFSPRRSARDSRLVYRHDRRSWHLVTLTVHGALYVAIKTAGSREPARARHCVDRMASPVFSYLHQPCRYIFRAALRSWSTTRHIPSDFWCRSWSSLRLAAIIWAVPKGKR